MKAEIILLTPQIAHKFLEMNLGNRKLKNQKNDYANQMKRGLWKENGEPIIIDTNGFVKDGQHRLHAVIIANYSYYVPLITEVSPDVMDTIDTGTNRSLNDILQLNGFKYAPSTAAAIKVILKHEAHSINPSNNSGRDRYTVTNSVGLDYAKKNKDNLHKMVNSADRISHAQNVKLLSMKEICWFIYSISGYDFNNDLIKFLKGCGNGMLGSNSASYYAYKKLLDAKMNKIKLSGIYKHNLIVKCWNIFAIDDQPVKRLNIELDKLQTPIEKK
mgnify:CR=1 FL=1